MDSHIPGRERNSLSHEQSMSPNETNLSTIDPASTSMPQGSRSGKPTVPLDKLQPMAQWIHCPGCQKQAETVVKGRSDGMMTFMNIMWWPLPGREHWWETTKWHCSNCHKLVARQKSRKNLEVMA
ncbi:hypothetical protein QQS21_007063 [Conoideocrella luteorostrata]|uniref:LITAF domain-containing protein n=1 Tax=Conoideocrella luteorostrata TaxID=1105319 RepID=A0AAJ0CLU3_9HYPO|nr:hypothetical protein QQS21_007063 [Conoideocrella luteorostrata]